MFWLAHGHPLLMAGALVAAGLALRAGLEMRRRRRTRQPRERGLLRRHLAIAKPAVAVIVVGFLGGPISAVWLRDWTPFERLHSWVGLTAAALFIAAAVLGRRLERGRGRPVDAHALLGMLAVLAGALAAVTGFVLLP